MRKLLLNGAIYLYGDVREEDIDGVEGFTPLQVAEALAEHGPGDITVRLNSGGGRAHAGMAIYSQLKRHQGRVTIGVDGIAASAASLIFMAGAERHVRVGTMVMIHDPASISIGTAKDHADASENLAQLSDNYARVYAAASGQNIDRVKRMMSDTTWFTAETALAQGFATKIVEDRAHAFAAFDYRIYDKAPRALTGAPAPVLTANNAAATAARMRMRLAAL